MPLKEKLINGIGYTAITKYSGVVISLINSAILARILSPEDFGVVAVAMVIITFFGIFSDLGISPAIVQNNDLGKQDLSELFSFSIWLGIVLSILFFFSAPLIASYYQSTILTHLCQLLSLNLIFNTINIVPNALLYKNKEFKYLAIRSFFIQFLIGIIAVLSASWGAGIYALLINPIVASGILFL
ncbi:MAG: oligosaccharide flippase family protein, partial [Massilibacteroides sp.]|nr:oligosaccharide flippase family protein [Massilibacteroides sp.]